MNQALIVCLLLSVPGSPELAQNQFTVKKLLKVKGPPAFTTKSMKAQGNLLICDEFEISAKDSKAARKKLKGRTLLFCDSEDTLVLWIAVTHLNMRRATPLPGKEDPNQKINGIIKKKTETAKLWKPAKVFMAVVDKSGKIVRTSEFTVRQLQYK